MVMCFEGTINDCVGSSKGKNYVVLHVDLVSVVQVEFSFTP